VSAPAVDKCEPLQELSLTFIGSSAVPAAAVGRLCQYQGLTQLALEGCPRWVVCPEHCVD